MAETSVFQSSGGLAPPSRSSPSRGGSSIRRSNSTGSDGSTLVAPTWLTSLGSAPIGANRFQHAIPEADARADRLLGRGLGLFEALRVVLA